MSNKELSGMPDQNRDDELDGFLQSLPENPLGEERPSAGITSSLSPRNATALNGSTRSSPAPVNRRTFSQPWSNSGLPQTQPTPLQYVSGHPAPHLMPRQHQARSFSQGLAPTPMRGGRQYSPGTYFDQTAFLNGHGISWDPASQIVATPYRQSKIPYTPQPQYQPNGQFPQAGESLNPSSQTLREHDSIHVKRQKRGPQPGEIYNAANANNLDQTPKFGTIPMASFATHSQEGSFGQGQAAQYNLHSIQNFPSSQVSISGTTTTHGMPEIVGRNSGIGRKRKALTDGESAESSTVHAGRSQTRGDSLRLPVKEKRKAHQAPQKYPSSHNAPMYTTLANARAHLASIKWRPSPEDTWYPQNDQEKFPYVQEVYDAMVDTQGIYDNTNGKTQNRMLKGQYDQRDIAAKAWEVVECAVQLHSNGATLLAYTDPTQKTQTQNNRSTANPTAQREKQINRNLSFRERLEEICKGLKQWKAIGCDVMEEKLAQLVYGPKIALKTKGENAGSNDNRKVTYDYGKQKKAEIASTGTAPSHTTSTNQTPLLTATLMSTVPGNSEQPPNEFNFEPVEGALAQSSGVNADSTPTFDVANGAFHFDSEFGMDYNDEAK